MTQMNLPPRDEWDFSTKKERPQQPGGQKNEWTANVWLACYYYELARHPNVVKKIANHFRQGITASTFNGYRKATRRLPEPELPSKEYRWLRFITLFPEWPAKPFAAISKIERKKRFDVGTLELGLEDRGDPVIHWDLNLIIGVYMDYVRLPKTCCDQEAMDWINGDLDGPLWNGRGTIIRTPGAEIVCFEIDWTLGETRILQALKKWLKDHHPTKVPLMFRDRLGRRRKADSGESLVSVRLDHLPPDFPIQARDSEGRIGPPSPGEKSLSVSLRDGRKEAQTKRCQAALRRLGASRIWAGFNGNWPAVEAAIQENRGEMMTVLGSQYKSRSAWSRAQTRTAKNLTKFNI